MHEVKLNISTQIKYSNVLAMANVGKTEGSLDASKDETV